MMRSFTAPFYARGDTLTPVKAALLAAAVNIALKVVLMGPLAQVGLALATSVGAWINLTLLTIFARQQGFAVSGAGLRPVIRLLLAGAVLAVALYFGSLWLAQAFAGLTYFREETTLAVLLFIGTIIYALDGAAVARARLAQAPCSRMSARRRTLLPSKTPQPPDPTSASSSLPDNTPPPTV